MTAKSTAHYERFAATRERMFAESLFRHRVTDMQYTADGSEIWIGQRSLVTTKAPEPSTRGLLLIR